MTRFEFFRTIGTVIQWKPQDSRIGISYNRTPTHPDNHLTVTMTHLLNTIEITIEVANSEKIREGLEFYERQLTNLKPRRRTPGIPILPFGARA